MKGVMHMWAALRFGVSKTDWALAFVLEMSKHGMPLVDFVVYKPDANFVFFSCITSFVL